MTQWSATGKEFPLTDLVTVLHWVNAITIATGKPDLIVQTGAILEKILLHGTVSAHSNERNHRVGRAAFRNTRHALAETFEQHNTIDDFLQKLLSKASIGSLIIFGALSGAASELQAVAPKVYEAVDSIKAKIIHMYSTLVLGSKTPLSSDCVEAFYPFFMEFATQDDFTQDLRPSISKSLLRAPEVVLIHIIPGLLNALSPTIDLAQCTSEHLITSLIGSFSSSNHNLREHAVQCAILLVSKHCFDEKFVFSASEKVLAQAKKTTASDQRLLFGRLLSSFNKPNPAVADGLTSVVSREINEQSLSELVKALLINSEKPLTASVTDALVKGCTEKRLNLRRVWICAIVENAEWVADDSKILEPIKKTFAEIVANPSSAIQSKSIASAFAYLVMSKSLNEISMNSKVYSRLSDSDLEWNVRAASIRLPETISENWGAAWIHFITEIPRFSTPILQQLYSENSHIVGQSLLSAMNPVSQSGLSKIFNSIFTIAPDEENLVKALLPAHFKSAAPKGGWINLVIKAGIDPGNLVVSHFEALVSSLEETLNKTDSEEALKSIGDAFCTICFIDPNLVTPKIVNIFKKYLEQPREFTPEELLIFNTPEGELANIESKTTKVIAINKNSKEYKEKMWEESVRKELAAKKAASGGQVKPKKLTKEEEARLQSESTTRKELQYIQSRLWKGLSLVKSFSTSQYTTGIENWFPDVVSLIKPLLSNQLISKDAVETYLKLSSNISSRLGSSRFFTGLAVVRVLVQNPEIDSALLDEPVNKLVLRILYQIKLLVLQRPFDTNTFIYMSPMLLYIIENSKDEEQLLLALDIVAAHGSQIGESGSTGQQLLTSLVSLLSLSSSATLVASQGKRVKDTLMSVAQNLSLNTKEQLEPLLDGVIKGDNFVRSALLEVLDAEADLSEIGYSSAIYISLFDEDPVCRDFAADIWKENDLHVDEKTSETLIDFIGSKYRNNRVACGKAIAASIAAVSKQESNIFENILEQLINLYSEKAKPPVQLFDKYGIPIQISKFDMDAAWACRHGIALTMKFMAPLFLVEKDILRFFDFAIFSGAALADIKFEVRDEFQNAGLEIIKKHGVGHIEALIPIMENYLAKPDKESQDEIREAVIIFYGSLASHLDPDDERILKIMKTLLATLETPSEDIQYAVAKRIAPLVKVVDAGHVQEFISDLTQKLGEADSLAKRKGAAYGLAGLICGSGIAAIADYDVIRDLAEMSEDKKNPPKRQGVQFSFETFSLMLGVLFEPYAIEVMPLILTALGDSSPDVRAAATDAAKQIMKNTTGYGVKKLIPLALENINLTAWRAKKGAVELLGNMAYLDPRQLSASLSTIIPEIVSVLGDTHKEVRAAANGSLKKFGEVIKNPEIQALVPTLLKAISDPTKHTEEALDGLLNTQFVHYIDAPSLALVTYVLHRGLKDRSAATKKKACQIVGNMSILTEASDLVPYLPNLVAELETAMVDPVPGTRAMASKALGSLVSKLGEEHFPDLIPQLLSILKDSSRAGDQLGSAQALAEVIYGLGIPKLEELLPDILKNCVSPKPWIRSGFMPLLLFLPSCFGQQLSPYLSSIVPPILSGLADTVDDIHDTALKAGRRLVRGYASKAVELMLPELEKGLADINYRIRLSSIELTGDLLFQITGVNKNSAEDVVVSSEVNKTLIDVLGQERRNRVLALLFMCRVDTSGQVRNSAVEVWMCLVANTPRTVKEILPTLTQIIIKRLASNEEEHRNIAARSLGELVKRVGGNALSQLLPTLKSGMEPGASDSDARQGICIALVSLVNASSPDVLEEYKPTVISIVKDALVDVDPKVREAAGQAFDALQEGGDAVDAILPNLIRLIQQGDDTALEATKEMMATKSDAVFPVLIPALLQEPMTAAKAHALGELAHVSGKVLYKRLSSVLNSLIQGYLNSNETDEKQTISTAIDDVMLSVTNDDGTHLLMSHLLALAVHEDSAVRRAILPHMAVFFAKTQLDLSPYNSDWIPLFVACLDNDNDLELVQDGHDALVALTKRLSKEEMERLVKVARSALNSQTSKSPIAGFNKIPKGPMCILPIFLQGLMYASSGEREAAALAIGDVIDRCEPASLKPLVTQIAGPLIRTIGERFSPDVKSAILYTLNKLLNTIPQFLKPFLPQLQRTFIKSLSDPTSNASMQARAARALGTLITLTPRVDPLITELITNIRTTTDDSVIKAMTQALSEIVIRAGKNLGPSSRSALVNFVLSGGTSQSGLSSVSDIIVRAKILAGIISASSDDDDTTKSLVETVLHDEQSTVYNKSIVINSLLALAGKKAAVISCRDEILEFFLEHALSHDHQISESCVVGIGKYLLTASETASGGDVELGRIFNLFSQITEKSENRSSDTRRLSLVVIRTVARLHSSLLEPYIDTLVIPVFSCVRDTQIPVKLAAEKAYLALFDLVEDESAAKFETWMQKQGAQLPPMQQRQIRDYTKRVASRLAAGERDRIAAGGDDEQLYSDRIEDEQEIWAIGGTEIAEE